MEQQFDVYSAGIEKHGLTPLAVRDMQEIGVDISTHQSKSLDDLDKVPMDSVVTVCGHADETCPAFPVPVRRLHVGFDDPPKRAADAASEDEAMVHCRRVHDEIAAFIDELPDKLPA